MEETDSELPALSQAEVLALLRKFLLAEAGDLRAGVLMHLLHWLVLTGHYTQRRERFQALEELVTAGVLKQTQNGTVYPPSSLGWPLITTSDTVREIEEARIRALFPILARWDRVIGAIRRVLPNALAAGKKLLPPGGG
jgi:hypothetical protein